MTGDPHSSYRANRDFLSIIFKSRVIAAAMKVLGFVDKSGAPTNYSLPPNMESMNKAERLHCLHELSAKLVDEFVFQPSSEVDGLVDGVLTEQEKDFLEQQEHQCRFPGCDRSLKYNGKSRRTHEVSHDPPVEMAEDPTQVTTSTPTVPPKDTKKGDDAYFSTSLMPSKREMGQES